MTGLLKSKHSSPRESVGFLFWKVSSHWQREIREALKNLELTHAQFVLLASLVWLSEHHDVVTQQLLSKQSSIDKMVVSDVVRLLESKRYIQRLEHPTDSRAVRLVPTSLGIRTAQKAIQLVEAVDGKFFELTDQEASDFKKTLLELIGE